MELTKSNKQTKQAPYDWSKYDRTYNNAIDLVAQCVGYHRQSMKPLRAIVLKEAYFHLFKKGLEILMKQQVAKFEEQSKMTFDGVEIKCGSSMQFDSIICEYFSTVDQIND